MATFYTRALFVGLVLLSVLSGCGCEESIKERPFGYIRLGKMEKVLPSTVPGEKFFQSLGLLLTRDEGGLSVMSTSCTHDLELLEMSPSGSFECPLCHSKFSKEGKVVQGPAKAELPRYQIFLDASVYGKEKDTLYVKVGAKRAAAWRYSPENMGRPEDVKK